MGTSKMDSSEVYALFEELKQKIDELGKKATPNDKSDSIFAPRELATLIDVLRDYDKKKISEIRRKVEDYERKLEKERSKDILPKD